MGAGLVHFVVMNSNRSHAGRGCPLQGCLGESE